MPNPIHIALAVFIIAILIPLFLIRFKPKASWLITVGLLVASYFLFFSTQCTEVGIINFIPCLLYSFISFLGIPYVIVVCAGATVGVGLSLLCKRYVLR